MFKQSRLILIAALGACTFDGSGPSPDDEGPGGGGPNDDDRGDAPPRHDDAPDGDDGHDDAPDGGRRCRPAPLSAELPWYGDNRAAITAWLDSAGCQSDDYDRRHKPVALFDWDNTVSKNDVGDAITFYAVASEKVRQPPGRDWKRTSRYLTDEAAGALAAACGSVVRPGQSLPTRTNLGCADEILSIYIDGKTRAAAPAFTGWNRRRMEPAYAWTAQLLAGNTHAEVARMTRAAVLPQLSAPQGTTQVVGTRTVNGWIRIYEQTHDVIRAAQSRGYDVWVITASPQDVVGALAPLVGIDASRVIGIRSLTDRRGELTYDFEGCGPVAAGESSMIPYIEGKRCWVNKVVYGDRTARAIERRPEQGRQIFGAGDSDTDIEFMRDARFKLAINRNRSELMCFAYRNENDAWRVNPMFIEPRAARATPYPCSTTACLAADGTPGPCRDEQGQIIPDQLDAVHP